MNWIKENPFATAVMAVTLVGVGALTFLCVQKAGQLSTANEEFASAKSRYDSLISEPIFPSDANLKKVQEQHQTYVDSATALKAQLAKREPALVEMSPTAFVDKLQKAVSEVRAAAQANSVGMPEDEAKFYLGFPAYQSSLPSAAAVPELNLQLDTIKTVVDKAIAARVTSINEITRDPLPVEGGAAAATPAPAPGNRAAGRPAAKPAEVVKRSTFTFSFTADQRRVQETMNAVLDTPQLVTIQLAHFENEQLKGPAKTIAAPTPETLPEEGQPTPPAGDPAAAAPLINFILGEEKVKVTTRFQIIRIPQPEAAAKS